MDLVNYDDVMKFYNNFAVLEKKVLELEILLESRGISVSHGNNDIGYGFIIPNKRGEKTFLSSNYHSKVFKTFFNGLDITKDMINYNYNPYQDQLNNWFNENGNIDEKIKSLTKREEELSHYAFTDSFNKYEYDNIEKELKQLKIKCIDGKMLKDKADIINNITPENKNIIKKYYEAIDDIVLYANTLNKLGKIVDNFLITMPDKVNTDLDLSIINDTKIMRQIEEYKTIMLEILSKYQLYENKDVKTSNL